MEFFEAVHTQRSIRRFRQDPVPEEALWKMIDAAIRAPSGGNTQPWAWLVIRNEAKRKVIADAIRWASGSLEEGLAAAEKLPTETARRMRRASVAFRHDVASAPVLIIPCLVNPNLAVQRHQQYLARLVDLRRRAEHDAGGARPGSGHRAHDL